MIYLFHGDHNAASRTLYTDALTAARGRGVEVRALAGDKLAAKDLESTLATGNLFTTEALAIEGLLSRVKSKEKDACLAVLNAYTGPKDIYLWEKKEVTKTNIPKAAKISLSKAPTVLFTFLDSLYPGNSQRALSLFHDLQPTIDDLFLFTMLSRTVTNLLITGSAQAPKFAPWQLSKLKGQAAKWEDAKLVDFHDQLLKIDYAVKTGATKLSYSDHLDILLMSVLG